MSSEATSQKPSRAELAAAWAEGLKAGKEGVSRGANPYTSKHHDLAKEWDAGWQEGKGVR